MMTEVQNLGPCTYCGEEVTYRPDYDVVIESATMTEGPDPFADDDLYHAWCFRKAQAALWPASRVEPPLGHT